MALADRQYLHFIVVRLPLEAQWACAPPLQSHSGNQHAIRCALPAGSDSFNELLLILQLPFGYAKDGGFFEQPYLRAASPVTKMCANRLTLPSRNDKIIDADGVYTYLTDVCP